MAPFDPDAAALPDTGVFGLPHDEASAGVVLVPVPFDATTSYRRGTSGGPEAILAASRQVDLHDHETGRPYEAGIHMLAMPDAIAELNREARASADPIIAAGGVPAGDPYLASSLARVNELCERVNEHVHTTVRRLLAADKVVGLIGGDHATPFGSIRAHAERYPGMGVLHVDAHADLRDAYEGFTWSHASIMHNVITRVPEVARLVQVGIRDFSAGELAFQRAHASRIRCHFDADLARARLEGQPFAASVKAIVEDLPADVYVSFDIDGLDPTLCPNTGTPVPGGLSWHEATYLLGAIARSGRRIVGFDVNEVAPGDGDDEWDGNVGARLVYKLIGWALVSRRR